MEDFHVNEPGCGVKMVGAGVAVRAHDGQAVARRLFLQRAPAGEVLRACKASEEWPSLAGQEALHAALVTDPAAKQINWKYRQRCLKALLHALDGHEICEGLLEAYISSDSVEAAAKGSDGGSVHTFEVNGAAIAMRMSDEIGGEAETSGCLWPACPALAAWLQAHASELAGASVLELGAGTGLASLTLACCSEVKTVLATDNSCSALSSLRDAVNALDPCIGSRVRVEALDWSNNAWVRNDESSTEPMAQSTRWPEELYAEHVALPSALTPALSTAHSLAAPIDSAHSSAEPVAHPTTRPGAELKASAFDLVIASDVVYNPQLLRSLCRTLGAILRASAAGASSLPRAWLAAERRSAETWALLLEELQREGLAVSDLSEQLRGVAAAQSTFYCAAESLGRLQLLEVTASVDGRWSL
jgi:predicted nicotinamide N-methyase